MLGLAMRLWAGKPVQSRLVASVSILETWMRLPFSAAPSPRAAVNNSLAMGLKTTPARMESRWASAIETQKHG